MGKQQVFIARTSLSPSNVRKAAPIPSHAPSSFATYSTTAGDLKAMLDVEVSVGQSVGDLTPPHLIRSRSTQAPPMATAKVSPSRLVDSLRLLGSVARPVSVAAAQVLTTWCGALSSGVRGAWQLRNDWNAALQANKQMREMKAKYQAEKQAAKERERAAMQRLQQLEHQIATMQQSVARHEQAVGRPKKATRDPHVRVRVWSITC